MPTTHQIAADEDGNFLVNKKQYGECKTVGEVVRVLHRELPGWPVPLTVAVPPKHGGGGGSGDDDDDEEDDDGGYLHVSVIHAQRAVLHNTRVVRHRFVTTALCTM